MIAGFSSMPDSLGDNDRAVADVSVVIVTYQSRSFIDGCIESIRRAATRAVVEVVVVDNASIDGTGHHIRSNWPDVAVVDTGWNAGFSRACNLGVRATRGRYVLLLNGDALLQDGAVDVLVDAMDQVAGPRVMAPRVCNVDGTDQGTARAFPTPAAAVFGRRSPVSRAFPNNRYTARYLTGRSHRQVWPFEVDWVSGACLMIDRSSWEELGGLDEDYFMYWEDADLCRRVKLVGGSVWCVPAASAIHAEGSSAGVTSPLQNRRFHASAYRYASKHMLSGPMAVARPLAAGALLARAVGVTASERTKRLRSSDVGLRTRRFVIDRRRTV